MHQMCMQDGVEKLKCQSAKKTKMQNTPSRTHPESQPNTKSTTNQQNQFMTAMQHHTQLTIRANAAPTHNCPAKLELASRPYTNARFANGLCPHHSAASSIRAHDTYQPKRAAGESCVIKVGTNAG